MGPSASEAFAREEHSSVMGSEAMYLFGGHAQGTLADKDRSILAYLF